MRAQVLVRVRARMLARVRLRLRLRVRVRVRQLACTSSHAAPQAREVHWTLPLAPRVRGRLNEASPLRGMRKSESPFVARGCFIQAEYHYKFHRNNGSSFLNTNPE